MKLLKTFMRKIKKNINETPGCHRPKKEKIKSPKHAKIMFLDTRVGTFLSIKLVKIHR